MCWKLNFTEVKVNDSSVQSGQRIYQVLLSSKVLCDICIVNCFFNIWIISYKTVTYPLTQYTVRYLRFKMRCRDLMTFSILSQSVLTLILSSGEDIAHRQVNQPKIKERSRNSVPIVHGGWQFTWNYIGVITSFSLLCNLSNEAKRRSNPQRQTQ